MKTKFWKIYAIVTGVVVAICAVVLIVLWTFLASYEKAQPEHKVEDVIVSFKNLDVDDIVKYYVNRSKFKDTDDRFNEAVKQHIQGTDYTYDKKMIQYTADNPTYSIKADGKEVAVVKLAKSDKRGAYNSIIWNIEDIDLGFVTDEYRNIIAPEDYTITYNGTTLTKDDVVENNINKDDLSNVSRYAAIPYLVKYKVDASYVNPEIKCVSALSGKEVEPSIAQDGTYTYDYETDESVIADKQDTIKTFIENYTKYMYTEAKFDSISGSVIRNSKAYDFLQYITYTSIWYADHSSLTIGDIELNNVKRYSDECYSVEADYTYSVVMADNNYTYNTKVILYYVKSGNSWKIADLQTK